MELDPVYGIATANPPIANAIVPPRVIRQAFGERRVQVDTSGETARDVYVKVLRVRGPQCLQARIPRVLNLGRSLDGRFERHGRTSRVKNWRPCVPQPCSPVR